MIHTGKQTTAASDDQCKLRTYEEGCPGDLTPHHCVPDHCFTKPPSQTVSGDRFPGAPSHAEGLCVCVSGATKSTSTKGESISKMDFKSEAKWESSLAEHGRIHAKFDKAESDLGKAGDPKNSAELGKLEDAAAKAISQVTGCDEADLKRQIRKHHADCGLGEKTKFRADPYGRRKAPPYTQMGTNTKVGGMGRG